nr:putative senescence regulator S40 [Ipomoea batatas]GMD70591.1 putative senescence regulator S40 [Ipomoea batatas]
MASENSFKPNFSELQFEFDESEDCWVSSTTASNEEVAGSETTVLPNLCRQVKTAVMNGGSSVVEQVTVTAMAVAVKSSVPMKIPDWRRILGVAYQRARRDSYEDEDEYVGLPPHLYLARIRKASLSGRSLKGRDLWRLRNAIWKRIGFED